MMAIQTPIESEMQDMDFLAMPEGRKDDGGKLRMDLIPPELLFAVGDVLTYGADKYSPRNWEAGMSWGRVFGALMRHMWAWWGGQGVDADTGKSHLWHAGCCIAFLIAYEARGTGDDDRPAQSDADEPEPTEWTDAMVEAMVDRHAMPRRGECDV